MTIVISRLGQRTFHHATESANGFFAERRVTTVNKLRELIALSGVVPYQPETLHDAHVTCCYSKVQVKRETISDHASMYPQVLAWAWWPGHNDKGYWVLKIDDQRLHDRHEVFISAGAVATVTPYEPHITVATGVSALPEQVAIANQNLLSLQESGPIYVGVGPELFHDLES